MPFQLLAAPPYRRWCKCACARPYFIMVVVFYHTTRKSDTTPRLCAATIKAQPCVWLPYYPQPNAKLPGFAITRLVAALHLAQTQNQTRTPAL
ncbi:hypothetical protein HK12_01585 [Acetobacter orientalis]|uniref:Uncharacterized protein n=1 Tax=Acetobacter orientalis TaxID=146474 RepID=A0A252A471_9PROT|nr:hypothetical protein HK12_01585 [Acetobacter orientalis]